MVPSTPSAAPPIEGVSLEQFAGVTAALVEGFALPAILEAEALEPSVWPRASVAWSGRVARSGPKGAIGASYTELFAFARTWLGRKVAPLDTDLAAWMGFLGSWSAHPEPIELLKRLEMLPSDVARIQGAWAERIEKNEVIRQSALEIAKDKRRGIPRLSVTRAALRPFPWTKGTTPAARPAAPVLPSPGIASVLDVSFYRYVAAKARLAEEPGNEGSILRKLGFADFAKIDVTWQERVSKDAVLAGDYRQLLRHERERLRAAAKRGDAPPGPPVVSAAPMTPPVVRPPSALQGTTLATGASGPALPFGQRPAEERPAQAEVKPAPRRPPSALGGTAFVVDAPRVPALPFAKLGSPASPLAPSAPPRPPPALAGTSLAPLDDALKQALPFAAKRVPEEPPRLTLQQHASLTVDIALAPERAMESLGRYGLTVPEKVALDALYRERLAADPAARAAWHEAYRFYHAWLTSRRPGA